MCEAGIELDNSGGRKGSIAGKYLRSRNALVGVMVECSIVDGRCSMSASLSLLGALAGGYKSSKLRLNLEGAPCLPDPLT